MQSEPLEIIFGTAIAAAAIGLLIYLVFWSRRRINRIARNGGGTARKIVKELER